MNIRAHTKSKKQVCRKIFILIGFPQKLRPTSGCQRLPLAERQPHRAAGVPDHSLEDAGFTLRGSKASHAECSECTAPCSAIVWEVFEREPLAELHLPHHSSWRSRQHGLPLCMCSGQTGNSGKSLLVPVGFA